MSIDESASESAAARHDAGNAERIPDPEVSAKPVRRKFSAEYKRRILQEAARCKPGEIGALLRREGLYSSHLAKWRRQVEKAETEALSAKKRGRKPQPPNPLARRVAELERENERLHQKLAQAEAIIEVQKKSPRFWDKVPQRKARPTDLSCGRAGARGRGCSGLPEYRGKSCHAVSPTDAQAGGQPPAQAGAGIDRSGTAAGAGAAPLSSLRGPLGSRDLRDTA